MKRTARPVVVYDDGTPLPPPAAWCGSCAGLGDDVRILDEGAGAPTWRAGGGDVETGEVRPSPATSSSSREDAPSSTEERADRGDGEVLLDARPASPTIPRRGRTIDPVTDPHPRHDLFRP